MLKPLHQQDGQLAGPTVGYRYEYTDGRKLANFTGNKARAGMCKRPLFLEPGRLQHQSPHPRCECGIRIVHDLETLSRYYSDVVRTANIMGVNPERPGGFDDVVVTRVIATGYAAHGLPQPEDPAGCLRVRDLELTDIYVPAHLDRSRFERTHGVPTHDLHEAVGNLFPEMRKGPPEASANEIREVGRHYNWFQLTVGDHTFTIWKGLLGDEMARIHAEILQMNVPRPEVTDRYWELLGMDNQINERRPTYRLAIARGTAVLLEIAR